MSEDLGVYGYLHVVSSDMRCWITFVVHKYIDLTVELGPRVINIIHMRMLIYICNAHMGYNYVSKIRNSTFISLLKTDGFMYSLAVPLPILPSEGDCGSCIYTTKK